MYIQVCILTILTFVITACIQKVLRQIGHQNNVIYIYLHTYIHMNIYIIYIPGMRPCRKMPG